jgi:hypothetical protein
MEESYRKKISKYYEEERRRREMEKIRKQNFIKMDMEKMKSLVKEMKQEVKALNEYEGKITKYQNRELVKKIMEESYKKKISKYYEKEEKWKNFSSKTTILLSPRKCGLI